MEHWLCDVNRLFYEHQLYVFVCNACVYVEGSERDDEVPVACTDEPVWEGAMFNTFPCFLTDLGEIWHKRSLRIAVG